jgi:hypothetical protein
MTEEAAIRNSKGEKTIQANTEKETKMKMGDHQINHPIKTKTRLPLAPQPGRRMPGAQRGHGRNQNDMGCFPRPLGGGWTAAGGFTSRRGPGEGVLKNLAQKTRNYGLAMQGRSERKEKRQKNTRACP